MGALSRSAWNLGSRLGRHPANRKRVNCMCKHFLPLGWHVMTRGNEHETNKNKRPNSAFPKLLFHIGGWKAVDIISVSMFANIGHLTGHVNSLGYCACSMGGVGCAPTP